VLELPLSRPDPLTPPPAHAELRQAGVVRVATAFGPAWYVTSADLAVTTLTDPRLGLGPPGVEVDVRASLFQDGPAHARLRRLVAGAFRPARIASLAPRLEVLAEESVDRVVAAGPPVDLVEALAAPLPVAVIGELIGLPSAQRERFRGFVDAALVADPMSGDTTVWDALGGFVAELVAARRAAPADDLLGDLLAVRDADDGRLDDEELVALVQVLLAAGTLTVRNALVQAVVRLLDEGRFAELDGGDVSALVEEVVRRAGTEPFPRFAAEELVLGGVRVAAGDLVLVSLEAANHDPARFPDPLSFRPGRPEQHLGFGHGPHFCLGAALARAELTAVLPVLARRLPGLRLDVPIDEVPWHRGLVDHGPLALPVRW
jgi:cytochrome P450